jgi:DNA polymerase III subunit alpha
MKYVSLHTHTTYSYGDGYGTVPEHVQRIADLGMTHLALTEHGNVSSWVALEKACATKGIEPIFGIEAYIGIPGEQRKTHMILLAMNAIGMQNINRLVTRSWQQFYYYPTIYWKDLKQYNDGIIALSGCADSALSCILLGGKHYGDKTLECSDRNFQRAVRGVERFRSVFADRYYLEVQRFPGLERTCALNPLLAEISSHTGVSLVATSDVHYPLPDQNALQRILHAAHRGGTVETADASWEYSIRLTYPESDKEIWKDLVGTGLSKAEAKSSIENTTLIAERCNGVKLSKAPLPKYVIEERDWEPWI